MTSPHSKSKIYIQLRLTANERYWHYCFKIWMLVSLQQLPCTLLPSAWAAVMLGFIQIMILWNISNLIACFERSIILNCTLCSDDDIPDWKPMVPTSRYVLNMCSMLSPPTAGALTLTDARCAGSQPNFGYVCEYG